MERVSLNGVELEFDWAGSGEAVVFIHGVGVADSFLPLAVEPALRDHYRVIRYRRRGYAGSSPIDGPVSVAEHAQDCRALLGALEVSQAHVVGHSYGCCVVLQLAVDAPGVASSLALFEPPLPAILSPQQFFEAMCPIMEKYMAQAEKDAATLFESDLFPLQEWRFDAEEAAKIKQPVLFLYGSENEPVVTEFRDLFHSLLPPRTEYDVMPGTNHLLHMRHPADAAARLAAFLKRHPVAV